MSRIHIDLESRSAVDLRKTGVYVYAESPTTDLWCAAYSVGNGAVELWTPDQPCPTVIQEAVAQGWTFHAWNASFERIMWKHILGPCYGWPEPKLEQWRCTMVAALAMGFPAALERAASALGLNIEKDVKGAALMKRMARPRSVIVDGGTPPQTNYVWWDDDERKQRLYAYCKRDVEVEQQAHRFLAPLNTEEQKLYALDQQINDRGVYIDADLCHAAKKIVTATADRLNDEMGEATDGAVLRCSNVGQLLAFCRENGVDATSLRKEKVTALLARSDLPETVRDALELRQDAAKASVKKLDSALAGRSEDGRAKGLFFFHGATTGRWAGRRVQPQNLQRPTKGADVENIIKDILTGNIDLVEMMHGSPLAATGNAIRGIVCAAPSHQLIAADLANIESRVLAWLAGEDWKLDAFRAYDAGTGPDIYVTGFAKAFRVDPEKVDDYQRLVGKVMELALGFGGGAGAFESMGRIYGVDIGQRYAGLCEANPNLAEQAEKAYRKRLRKDNLPRETWVAAEIIKTVWRMANPQIVDFWSALEASAMNAIQNPGQQYPCGKLCFLMAKNALWVQLPSGRPLSYPYPRAEERTVPWLDDKGKPVTKLTFCFKTEVNRQWVDSYAYGGLWSENVTQATARDILADALKRLDAAEYPAVLHAHDEVVAEIPQGAGSVEEFCRLMGETPHWAEGCPVSAAGWSGLRYRKG